LILANRIAVVRQAALWQLSLTSEALGSDELQSATRRRRACHPLDTRNFRPGSQPSSIDTYR
jgi:hypothetical protein